MNVWSLQDAKAKLSGLIKIAKVQGAQIITVHGKREAMLVPIFDDDDNVDQTGEGLVKLLENSPLRGLKKLGSPRSGKVISNRKIDL